MNDVSLSHLVQVGRNFYQKKDGWLRHLEDNERSYDVGRLKPGTIKTMQFLKAVRI